MNPFLAYDLRIATSRIRAGQYREAMWSLEAAMRLVVLIGDVASAERLKLIIDALRAYMTAVRTRDTRPLWSAYPRIMRAYRLGGAKWDLRPVHA